MLKQFVFAISIVIFISALNFAQEKNEASKNHQHQSDSVKVQKIDDDKETISTKPWNAVCPVKGNPIEEDSPTVEYNGKVYGFCCPGCDTKFAKNPEKYAKNLSEDGKRFIGKK
jgi:YHS domain-containing protein